MLLHAECTFALEMEANSSCKTLANMYRTTLSQDQKNKCLTFNSDFNSAYAQFSVFVDTENNVCMKMVILIIL